MIVVAAAVAVLALIASSRIGRPAEHGSGMDFGVGVDVALNGPVDGPATQGRIALLDDANRGQVVLDIAGMTDRKFVCEHRMRGLSGDSACDKPAKYRVASGPCGKPSTIDRQCLCGTHANFWAVRGFEVSPM